MPAFIPIASIVGTIVHRYGLEAKLIEQRLRREWPAVVGEQIAAHTRPDAIRFKKLYVIADSSVWLQQLTFLKPTLLKKINEAAGSQIITDIVLRVGEVSPEGSRVEVGGGPALNTADEARFEPKPESVAQAAAHAEAVSDPDLRAQLTALMARALDSQPDQRPCG